MKKCLVLFCSLISIAYGSFFAERDVEKYGVIKVPVADAVRYPMALYGMSPEADLRDQYNAMPSSPDTAMTPRAHQFLFNEIVEIIDQSGSEVHVRALNTYYLDEKGHKQSDFWILKENLFCAARFLGAPPIPNPIDYDGEGIYNEDVLTLQMPLVHGKIIFSAGTRFYRVPRLDDAESYAVCIFDYSALNECPIAQVPKELAYVDYAKSKKERFNDFIQLIQKWAAFEPRKIPFLWGGSSFDQLVEPGSFSMIDCAVKGKSGKAWSRVDADGNQIHTGYDAAQMILRGMQIVGLPYFAKTTYTAQQELSPVSEDDHIKSGDFICFAGGMIMVADATVNQIMLAGGYQHWNGVFHLISLNQFFEGLDTLQDLKNAIIRKKECVILDTNGKPWKSIKGLRLLRFSI